MSIRTKQIHQTPDRQIFDTYEEAVEHHSKCIKDWLATDPYVPVAAVLYTMDDDEDDEYYCSEHDMGMNFIEKAYWMFSNGMHCKFKPEDRDAQSDD